MPICTTVVGSWPIPFGQRLELKRYYAGELSDEEANGLPADRRPGRDG